MSDHNANRCLAVKSCSITIVPLKRNSKALQLSHSEKEGSHKVSLCQTGFQSVHWLFYELLLRGCSTVEQRLGGHTPPTFAYIVKLRRVSVKENLSSTIASI